MAYMIQQLISGWEVDNAIMHEESRLVIIRFGKNDNSDCMKMDDVLFKIQDTLRNFAVIY